MPFVYNVIDASKTNKLSTLQLCRTSTRTHTHTYTHTHTHVRTLINGHAISDAFTLPGFIVYNEDIISQTILDMLYKVKTWPYYIL